MRLTLQDPKSPPSKAPAPATAPVEPSAELVAHFSSPKTRNRLVGRLKRRFVPERNREDVVNTTLADAWKQRHSWPKTVEELDKLLFAILRCDRVDAARKERKEPLLRGKPGEPTNDDTPTTNTDDDPPEPGGITVTTEPQEEREAIKNAMDYADSRPRLKHPMRWLLQMYMGMSAREIARAERVTENVVYLAVSDLRAELRAKFGRVFILLALAALAYAIIHFIRVGRVNDQAHPPQPVPTVVAPPPAPAPAGAPPAQPGTQAPRASDKPATSH
jgi:DNA-directed RNA polymerase specialized sigma24 family protein